MTERLLKNVFENLDIENRSGEDSTGGRIKKLRKEMRLSQTELAQKIGGTHSMIYRYETNMNLPGVLQIMGLASALNTTEEYLLCKTDDPSPKDTVSTSPISVDLDRIIARAQLLKAQSEAVSMISEEDIRKDAEEAMNELIVEVCKLCIRPDIIPESIPDRIRALKNFIQANSSFLDLDGILGGKKDPEDK